MLNICVFPYSALTLLIILLCMSRWPGSQRWGMFSFAPGIGGLSRREGGSAALPGSRSLVGFKFGIAWESWRLGAGRRHWKSTMHVSLGSLPPPPKLLLLQLAIGKACICVATRAWDIPPCIEDCIVVLCSVVNVEGLPLSSFAFRRGNKAQEMCSVFSLAH